MDINELIQKENERHDLALKTIRSCEGLEKYIRFVEEDTIYLKITLINNLENVLHEFKKKIGDYKLFNYYMNNNYVIAVQYVFGSVRVMLYSEDVEEVLYKISGGKCRIKKNIIEKKTIVCGV